MLRTSGLFDFHRYAALIFSGSGLAAGSFRFPLCKNKARKQNRKIVSLHTRREPVSENHMFYLGSPSLRGWKAWRVRGYEQHNMKLSNTKPKKTSLDARAAKLLESGSLSCIFRNLEQTLLWILNEKEQHLPLDTEPPINLAVISGASSVGSPSSVLTQPVNMHMLDKRE